MRITRELLVSVHGASLDYTKLMRQQESFDKWASAGRFGTLDLIYRFGKTLIGCMAIDEMLDTIGIPNIVVLCPSETVQREWVNSVIVYQLIDEELAAMGVKIHVVTPTTITNNPDRYKRNVDLLIVDEIYKFTSDTRLDMVTGKMFPVDRVMFLSGTLPKNEKMKKILAFAPVVDKITEFEAIGKGWISPMEEYNVILDLPSATKDLYARHSFTISRVLDDFRGLYKEFTDRYGEPLFKSDMELIMACFRGGKTQLGYIKGQVLRESVSKRVTLSPEYEEKWTPSAIKERARLFVNAVQDRTELINTGYPKLDAVVKIFSNNQVSTICFNESTNFADSITDAIIEKFGPIATCFHTNMESVRLKDPRTMDFYRYKTGPKKGQPKTFGLKTLKDVAINGMITGDFKFLATARALDEGLTIAGIEQVITTAGTVNPLQYLQRSARGRTVDIYNPKKLTKVYNLTYNDFYITVEGEDRFVKSRDKTKLQLRQQMMNVKWVDMSYFD